MMVAPSDSIGQSSPATLILLMRALANTSNSSREREREQGVKKCETRKEIKIRIKGLGEHSWWDAQCKRNKRKVYKVYIRWKKERQGKEEYLRLRREFRENCKEKEEGNRKRIEEEIKNITTKAQIWKFMNLGRKKARIVDENISMEEWEKHFLELLEGERGR